MKTISTTAAAGRCDELLEVQPDRSEYLEACRDFYQAAGNDREWAGNLDAVLRAAATDTLSRGLQSPDGASQRRKLKGGHRIVLPGVSGPVRGSAWLHFETIRRRPGSSPGGRPPPKVPAVCHTRRAPLTRRGSRPHPSHELWIVPKHS